MGARAISPQLVVKQEQGPQELEGQNEEDIRADKRKSEEGCISPVMKKKKKRRNPRHEPLSDEMLYGPFDFSSHRASSTPKQGHRTSNLTSPLQDLVEGQGRGGRRQGFCLTPNKNEPGADRRKSFSLTPSKLGPVEGSPSHPPGTPTRNYIVPGRLGVSPSTPLLASATSTPQPRSPLVKEARLLVPRPRAPSVELVGEQVAAPVVVQVEDGEERSQEARDLAANLGAMFPLTPADYILARAADLVGRPAAIERFTEELLDRPEPPSDWKQIYARPWSVVQEKVIQQAVVLDDTVVLSDTAEDLPPAPPAPAGPPLALGGIAPPAPLAVGSIASVNEAFVVEDLVPTPASTSSSSEAASTNHVLTHAPGFSTEEEVQTDSAAAPPAPASSSSARPLNPDVDPLAAWQEEKQDFMVSMFPTVCPDWLQEQVQACCAPAPGPEQGVGVVGALVAAGARIPAPAPPCQESWDLRFQTKVEEIFLLSLEDRSKLPTRREWELRQKQRAELEKWSGAMSVRDMLELYQDDPAGYFGNPERKPESLAYKEHALAALKDTFRFHSITEIEKSFKKARCLFTPAFRQLKHLMETGKKTRKTQRPDFEIKYPIDPCIKLLKEKKFCELEGAITEEKSRRATEREAAVEAARAAGSLEECGCCYHPDCLVEDMVQCKGGHYYCKECVARGASVAIGDGKTIIECLGHCSEEIGWQELQKALAPNILSKLLQRRQVILDWLIVFIRSPLVCFVICPLAHVCECLTLSPRRRRLEQLAWRTW